MQQTPVHDKHNADLLHFMPANARRVIEVGCSSGALAREYKKRNPQVHYTGIEIEPAYAAMARQHCDVVLDTDIEKIDDALLKGALAGDCWVFGDVLEHLNDPWLLLARIRQSLPPGGCVVACIPNAQHWSLQVRLSIGEFRYEDSGLLDRTHIRWFTKRTIHEMFQGAGFTVEEAVGLEYDEPARDVFLPIVRMMAVAAGADGDACVEDAAPMQYIFRCVSP
ncbi:MAG: class I SAM-dependent methyltransferase [Betaproteobacteria bacterium]